MNDIRIKQDCRNFWFDRPCVYHKNEGAVCHSCNYYTKVDKRILVIKLDALGDVLRTMAILPPLKKKYPNSYVTWITRENAIALFENVDLVDEVLDYANPMVTHLLQTVEFDLVLNPDANKAAALLASCARACEKKGFTIENAGELTPLNQAAREWFLMGINDEIKKRNTKTYQQIILNLLELDGFESYIPLQLSEKEMDQTMTFKKENGLQENQPVIGLNIGAGGRWQNKAWPVEHFEILINQLVKKNFQIILLGGPEEKDKINFLSEKYNNTVVNGGYNNPLRKFFSIVNSCDVMVSSDTMAAHAGLALKKKVIVFIGPTSINEFEIYENGVKLHADMECLVCYRSRCNDKPSCMDQIKPNMVVDAIVKIQRKDN